MYYTRVSWKLCIKYLICLGCERAVKTELVPLKERSTTPPPSAKTHFMKQGEPRGCISTDAQQMVLCPHDCHHQTVGSAV